MNGIKNLELKNKEIKQYKDRLKQQEQADHKQIDNIPTRDIIMQIIHSQLREQGIFWDEESGIYVDEQRKEIPFDVEKLVEEAINEEEKALKMYA